MKIGIIFHKNPLLPPSGIDLIRLRAISNGLIKRGIEAEILAPVERDGLVEGLVPVRPLDALKSGAYDLVKTCYHPSIALIRDYPRPIVSRIVRVVDDRLPERDEASREELLACQAMIRDRASCVVLNNAENAKRWHNMYGNALPVVLVPTGCPAVIPPAGDNPFGPHGEKVILFLGSLAAPRMIRMINEIAQHFEGRARVHFIGQDKSHLYGRHEGYTLSPLVIQYGELPETDVWNYIRHAHIGLALATGPYPFDNDMSKIYSYLRGGLAALSEGPIVNNALISKTGLGLTFTYDDMEDLLEKAGTLLQKPPTDKRETTMAFMAQMHSWEQRVDTYVKLFRALINNSPIPDP